MVLVLRGLCFCFCYVCVILGVFDLVFCDCDVGFYVGFGWFDVQLVVLGL